MQILFEKITKNDDLFGDIAFFDMPNFWRQCEIIQGRFVGTDRLRRALAIY